MTATPVQTTLEDRVLEWTETLCESLAENYKLYHRRMIETNSAVFNADGNKELSDYAQKQIDEMDNGTAKLMKFRISSGKKYYKIIQQDYDTFRDRNEYRDGSVHAFINKKTGEVFKPASWKSPAKHVRYDLRIIKEREYVLNPENCGWAGGYLYMR
jgi:hypothetical protein